MTTSIDATVGGSLTAISQSVTLDVTRKSSATITLSGTWVGTVQFEAATDAAFTNPIAVPSAPSTTANGVWSVNVAAYAALRARSSAWTSGTATVAMRASTGSSAIPSRKKAGVPHSAVNEVQLLQSTGTISSGTLTLTVPKADGSTGTTAATSVTATHTTVQGNIQAVTANAACMYGSSTLATMWCPIIFTGPQAYSPQALITVDNSLVVGGGTFAVTRIQAGYAGDFVGAAPGDLAMDTTTGLSYVNVGTAAAPVWKAMHGYKNGHRFVFTGTSITGNGTQYLSFTYQPGGLWPTAACIKSSGKVQLVFNGGVPGATTAQVLTSQPWFLQYNPDWVMVEGGINDIPTNANTVGSYATNIAAVNAAIVNLQAICEFWLARGVRVGLSTTPANSAGKSFYVTALNAKIKKLAQTLAAKWNVQIPLCDMHRVTVDPTATGANAGNYLASFSSDTTHPDLLAATKAISDEFVATVVPLLPTLILPAADTGADVSGNAFNLMVNTVTFTDTNADGTADSWTIAVGGTISATATVVTDSAVLGKMQQVVNGATGSGNNDIKQTLATVPASGQKLAIAGQYSISGLEASPALTQIFLNQVGGTTGFTAQIIGNASIDVTGGWFYAEFVPPATGFTGYQFFFRCAAQSATFRVGRVTVWQPDAL